MTNISIALKQLCIDVCWLWDGTIDHDRSYLGLFAL